MFRFKKDNNNYNFNVEQTYIQKLLEKTLEHALESDSPEELFHHLVSLYETGYEDGATDTLEQGIEINQALLGVSTPNVSIIAEHYGHTVKYSEDDDSNGDWMNRLL